MCSEEKYELPRGFINAVNANKWQITKHYPKKIPGLIQIFLRNILRTTPAPRKCETVIKKCKECNERNLNICTIDITSEDVSTNSVMPHPQAGEVDLICKQDGIICGLQVFERVFTLLDADTKVEFYVKDGDKVENKQLIGKVYGGYQSALMR